MHKLVFKCNLNLPVIPLLLRHEYSTDDNTTDCYKGKGEKKASFALYYGWIKYNNKAWLLV